MATDIGGIFEDQLESAFTLLKASHYLGWHRFPDTASAGGNIMQSQPSDYLVAAPRGCKPLQSRLFFVEAKASEKHTKLQKASIRPSQRGAISFYSALLHLPYFLLFWDVQGRRVEVWEGVEALKSSRKKEPLTVIEGVSVHTKIDPEKLAKGICQWLGLPKKTVTFAGLRNLE